ncbi:MAG: hypothetical protein ABJC36_11870 [Gemmatimonadales bacterium]
MRWTGADTATFSAPATAERCEALHLIEIRAVSGDTGVGLALYDSGSIQPGTYRIRTRTASDTSRPGASLALRWFSKTAVQGFQGDSGEALLRPSGADAYSGTFRAKANAITGAGRLDITGSFDGVRLGRARRTCVAPADTAKASPDSAELEVVD